ncbi:MAG: hypothetical protein II365_04045 [Clostridia bacterium]|nr:hypothetical protein [Clostridia bacterium]
MFFKLLGCLMVLGGGIYMGIASKKFEAKKMKQLDAFIALIVYIKGQIDCFSAPIDDILRRADPALLMDCGCTGSPKGFSGLLENCEMLQSSEVRVLLEGFCDELGGSFREQQIVRCDYYLERLDAERNRQMPESKKKTKLQLVLWICAAAGIITLLW